MQKLKTALRQRAFQLGFQLCGVSPAAPPEHIRHYLGWIQRGWHGQMEYLARTTQQRLDPSRIMPRLRSVVVVAVSYNTPFPLSIECADPGRVWISRYAWGVDYHKLMAPMMRALCRYIEKLAPSSRCRWYVDTGPVSEKLYAFHAGLGWIGKNSCLINSRLGSHLFLGVILSDIDLPPDAPHVPDGCGNCTYCMDACPTGAIAQPRMVDARRCIAYLTIEHPGDLPPGVQLGGNVFGCDICQDVCPYNHGAPTPGPIVFWPREELFHPSASWLSALRESEFRAVFRETPVLRRRYGSFMKTVRTRNGQTPH